MRTVSLFLGFCVGMLILAAAYRIAIIDAQPIETSTDLITCIE